MLVAPFLAERDARLPSRAWLPGVTDGAQKWGVTHLGPPCPTAGTRPSPKGRTGSGALWHSFTTACHRPGPERAGSPVAANPLAGRIAELPGRRINLLLSHLRSVRESSA